MRATRLVLRVNSREFLVKLSGRKKRTRSVAQIEFP
jgi:hypothetical protein